MFQLDIPYGTPSVMDEHHRIKSRSVRGSACPRPLRHHRGPACLNILGNGAGPCLLNLPRKVGRSDDQESASQPDVPDRTTGHGGGLRFTNRARAVFSCRTRPRIPIGELGRRRPFGENYGGGGSRGDSNRRRRRRHPRQERIRPRTAGHSCFCHSPARSPATTRHEDEEQQQQHRHSE